MGCGTSKSCLSYWVTRCKEICVRHARVCTSEQSRAWFRLQPRNSSVHAHQSYYSAAPQESWPRLSLDSGPLFHFLNHPSFLRSSPSPHTLFRHSPRSFTLCLEVTTCASLLFCCFLFPFSQSLLTFQSSPFLLSLCEGRGCKHCIKSQTGCY